MQYLLKFVLVFASYAHAQIDETCDIPLTCSDGEQDDDADFDSTVPFPAESYRKEIANNQTVGNIVAAYTQADRITGTILEPNWYNVCPSYYYTIQQWSFYHQKYGICYVITPIKAVRCASYYCRYIVISDPFQQYQKYYRCYPYYRRVYFWAYCPDPRSGETFIYTYRYVPGGCSCRRYVCPVLVAPSK